MTNLGIAPPDFTTPVGQFRLQTNDTVYTELDPAVPGFGNYTHSSDSEIEVFIEQGTTLSRSLGYYYLYLASQAALEAKSIKDHDLSVNTEKRADLLRQIAQEWFDRADDEDGLAGAGDIFDSFAFGGDRKCRTPELAPCWRDCGC